MLTVADGATGPYQGHMARAGSPVRVLSAAMQVRVGMDGWQSLDRRDAIVLATRTGDEVVLVELGQDVKPVDRPGTYRIDLEFQVIATF